MGQPNTPCSLKWNIAGLKDTRGYPTATSHYGMHMAAWHIPLAVYKIRIGSLDRLIEPGSVPLLDGLLILHYSISVTF